MSSLLSQWASDLLGSSSSQNGVYLANNKLNGAYSSVLSRYTDLKGAGTSSHGSFGTFGMGGTDCFTIDICPDLLLAGFAAAAAAAFWLIYAAITMNAGRRKRSVAELAQTFFGIRSFTDLAWVIFQIGNVYLLLRIRQKR